MAKAKKPTKDYQLKPLKVKTVEKAVKKGDVPVILVEGDYCSRYNEAAAIVDDADGLLKALKPLMMPDALSEIYRHNSERPWEPIVSVVLQDEQGKKTRLSFTSSYKDSTAVIVEALFGELTTTKDQKANVNDYVARTMEGSFDSNAFLGPDGKFSQERYDAITKAMADVAAKLGINNPLSTVETVKPLKDFHARRWLDFDRAANEKITRVLQNTVQVVPVAEAKKEEGDE